MCKIASWFQKNHLTLNVSKTKLMLFGTPQNLSKYQNISFSYDGETIERVDNFKYLGIVFDSHMTWSHHIDLIASNVSKHCGVIRRVKYYHPNYILKKLADSLVMPHFDYCSYVWSNCSLTLSSKLQILLNNLARIILSADIRTNIDSTMSSLKWLKLDDRWNNHILVMLYKCLTGRAPDYLCSKFSFLPIPLMTMTQEVLPPIHLLFLSLKITLVRDCFRPELQICGIVLLMLIIVLIIFPWA